MSFAKITVLAVVAMAGMVMGESCYCPENYNPICASNGQVFSNLCMMNCHNFNKQDNLVVAERDVCSHHATNFMAIPKLNCFRMCPHTPLPVCGSDGMTYGSACALKCLKEIENAKALSYIIKLCHREHHQTPELLVFGEASRS
ncbi:hypothetical protein GE061_002407 [Apolygus lucorum]|uniref:Kazal-like domain-containing protein n=1 Tax=Apolygus lucorum TaxID=248454 RepID=A0A6A4JJ59_APOLU|nr:hypothetical protein GE061_002407 [Apolygus lucorum]